MKDLIEKLEKATGPDRQIDNEIARLIYSPIPTDPVGWPPLYTSSFDAGMTLIPEACYLIELRHVNPTWWAAAIGHRGDDRAAWDCDAPTGELALATAAFKARAALSSTHTTD